jgi:5-formyltetrahydrofolate cyclo-ligase
MTLGVKLGRRLLAAVAFDDEQVIFCDSRFVPSKREDLHRLAKYIDQLIAQVQPTEVVYYAPSASESVTEQLAGLLEATMNKAGIPTSRLTRQELFASFGTPPVRTRRELRECLSSFVPQVNENKTARHVVMAEAAAAALVGEFSRGLRGS